MFVSMELLLDNPDFSTDIGDWLQIRNCVGGLKIYEK